MLIVKYQLGTGEAGEDVVVGDAKWVFGRPDGDDVPDLASSDRRVSRTSLVVRDSGPGPVVFRGQRGEAARVVMIATDGTETPLAEGTAGHFTTTTRRVELSIAGERVVTLEVDFAERGSVVERQHQADGTLPAEPSADLGADL
ncbi:MAG: hypothetical protein PGN07_10135 [Aeromicrobium erythreum]